MPQVREWAVMLRDSGMMGLLRPTSVAGRNADHNEGALTYLCYPLQSQSSPSSPSPHPPNPTINIHSSLSL